VLRLRCPAKATAQAKPDQTNARQEHHRSRPPATRLCNVITRLRPLVDEPTRSSTGACQAVRTQQLPPASYRGCRHCPHRSFRKLFERADHQSCEASSHAVWAQFAKRLGLMPRSRISSVALGRLLKSTPLEMAGAYTAFANEGPPRRPHALLSSDSGRIERIKPTNSNLRQ